MLKKYKKAPYKSLVIPDEIYIDNFENETAEKAILFSNWYFSQTEMRINVLQEYIYETGYKFNLDYSYESLVNLWSWFEDNLKLIDKTEKEIEDEKSCTPKIYWKYICKQKITHTMVEIAIDISYYFINMLFKNHSNLHPDCIVKPKWKKNLKKPVVSGFFYGYFILSCRINIRMF